MKAVVIRSTAIFKDSRTTKLIKELLSKNVEVLVLGWDRLSEYSSQEEMVVGENKAKIIFYKEHCPYGGGIKNLPKSLRFQRWVKKMVKSLPNDYVIHSCDYDTAKPAFKARGKKKFIYDIFDYFSESRNLPTLLKKFVQKGENKIVNKADAVVICTEQRREQIKDCSPKNLYVIHNTPNLNVDFETQETLKGDKFKVVYVGVLAENRLLKEILETSKDHPNVELHIGGIGALSSFVKDIAERQDNVIYYGSMNYEDVLKLEKQTDLLFATYDPSIPNHRYSAPNKFYEAGALAKPIIVCKNTGVDVLVENSNCGLTIEYDAKDFYQKVQSLIKDKDLYQTLCKNGKTAYDTNYSWAIMQQRIEQLYKTIEN
ncbi:MAG: glycosyltransferase family 4 protein [Clostridia bacterium]|nr:glycosyltransferase family 4 protein [Clostridia bacterium]